MNLTAIIRQELGSDWIPTIYEERIRPQRTRSLEMDIAARENSPTVLHTLLGIELKVGRRRIACPDLATARYLLVFARIGCRKIAAPYDITKLPQIADHLEDAWCKMDSLIARVGIGQSPQMLGRIRAGLMREIRAEIEKIGAGEMMPLFNSPTRQRNSA